mgnify:CR=1 FL=1
MLRLTKNVMFVPAGIDMITTKERLTSSGERPRRPVTKKPSRYTNIVTAAYDAYKSMVCALLFIGTCLVLSLRSPEIRPLMSKISTLPVNESSRRNPTWGHAIKDPKKIEVVSSRRGRTQTAFREKENFQAC